MHMVPNSERDLVPGDSLLVATPAKGRSLALVLARHTVHSIQPDLDLVKAPRPDYVVSASALIAASLVVAIECATFAAANDCSRVPA